MTRSGHLFSRIASLWAWRGTDTWSRRGSLGDVEKEGDGTEGKGKSERGKRKESLEREQD